MAKDFSLREASALVCHSVGSEASAYWLNFCHVPLGLAAALHSCLFLPDGTLALSVFCGSRLRGVL